MSGMAKDKGRGPTIGTMGVARYYHLDRFGGTLAELEVAAGWHFCPEWDEMLVGPGMPELESCLCEKGEAKPPGTMTADDVGKPTPVDTCVAEHVANEAHGDRYGIDWIYHDDRLGYLPAKPVKSLKELSEVLGDDAEGA